MLTDILQRPPHAHARIMGSPVYAGIMGRVDFYQTDLGVIVSAEVDGLPMATVECSAPIFGLHIHDGSTCDGTAEDPFANVGQHYNPKDCSHPHHAGDLPPLFGNDGYALQIFLTNRFTVEEILGKTIIIHSKPDDFTTQPSGNAGDKIACGEIRRF